MIPEFESSGILPAGVHKTSLAEFCERFGCNEHRQRLLTGFNCAVDYLRFAGCRLVYVDGSFVTNKKQPRDYDAAWQPQGVDVDMLLQAEPCFGLFDNGRAAQKTRLLGEWFPADMSEQLSGKTFLDFFQHDKDLGVQKGIIAIDLNSAEGSEND
jgi:hypothetical protein